MQCFWQTQHTSLLSWGLIQSQKLPAITTIGWARQWEKFSNLDYMVTTFSTKKGKLFNNLLESYQCKHWTTFLAFRSLISLSLLWCKMDDYLHSLKLLTLFENSPFHLIFYLPIQSGASNQCSSSSVLPWRSLQLFMKQYWWMFKHYLTPKLSSH